jgi:hypothetical protein
MMIKALVRMSSISSLESINQLCNYNIVHKYLEYFHIKRVCIIHRQLYDGLYITMVKQQSRINLIIIYTIAVVGRASRLSSNLKGI